MKKDNRYYVKWLDHFSLEGFFPETLDEVKDMEVVFDTVGYYVGSSTHYHIFARTKGAEQYADLMYIIKELMLEHKEI